LQGGGFLCRIGLLLRGCVQLFAGGGGQAGAFSRAPEGAVFVIAAKLCLASLLYACAAGGSFLVLARK
jgi:hypothetical protein